MVRTSKMSFFDAKSMTRLFFDDYELDDDMDGEVIAWTEMCPACKRKYLGILGQNRFDDGSAQGICGVEGCQNEADSYVDFKLNEVNFLW